MRRFYVYVLYSRNIKKTYVGCCSNLINRLRKHRKSPTKTTRKACDYKLVWYGSFISKPKAYDFEKYLKTRSGRVMMKKRLLGKLGSDDRTR